MERDEFQSREPSTSGRNIKLVLIAWMATLGFDFFLHGGLLARQYLTSTSFLLNPTESFQRIPIGYLGLLILAGFLIWIFSRLAVRGWREGLKLGAIIGGVMWVSLAFGIYSISTAPPGLLLTWVVGQTVGMAYGGAVIGQGLVSQSLRSLFLTTLLVTLGFIILTIAMQSTGLVPSVVIE